ncbi:uncharacterized protein FOBCDRAFT_200254 [Fusarium oxysporum Fo47]|uniref:uncharacterized protein n=1 Tax=Fusarium oxysporum Fo47 TaxID=660027 RepID=UPI002869B6ED|nr:uncharacterized protein FOBCDRAFT_200254 [Fusarium oxysporum Fo47]WJG35164.1 hypothetical protein FOBCDRAFT_200254 [Fusarium oxysporum Fo47]
MDAFSLLVSLQQTRESVDIRSWIHGKGEDESTLELGAVAATLHRGRLDKPLRIGRRLNGSWLNRFSGSAPTNHKTYVPDAWRQWSKPPLILDPRQRAIPGYCEPPQSSQLSKDRP